MVVPCRAHALPEDSSLPCAQGRSASGLFGFPGGNMLSRFVALARRFCLRTCAGFLLCLLPLMAAAQPSLLGEGPWYYDTQLERIKVSVLARGIRNPWGMVFLPSGNILIAEKPGAFRIIRDGVLDPEPVAGAPEVRVASGGGLMDIALHPRYAENRLVYFTYVK